MDESPFMAHEGAGWTAHLELIMPETGGTIVNLEEYLKSLPQHYQNPPPQKQQQRRLSDFQPSQQSPPQQHQPFHDQHDGRKQLRGERFQSDNNRDNRRERFGKTPVQIPFNSALPPQQQAFKHANGGGGGDDKPAFGGPAGQQHQRQQNSQNKHSKNGRSPNSGAPMFGNGKQQQMPQSPSPAKSHRAQQNGKSGNEQQRSPNGKGQQSPPQQQPNNNANGQQRQQRFHHQNFHNPVFNGKYKTVLCHSYTTNHTCKYGDKCLYAHGMGELRSLPSPTHPPLNNNNGNHHNGHGIVVERHPGPPHQNNHQQQQAQPYRKMMVSNV